MRSIILLTLPSLILAGPFCMCPNGQAGQAISCPVPPEPSCPEPKPCENDKKPFSEFELPSFPTLPPLDTKKMFRDFSMPTLPPSLNFFPNLFESTTTESPDTPAPTAPPPPPAPMEPSTLPPFVNPTLAPYNQRVPLGVPGTQQFFPQGAAVVSGATESPMASSWRGVGGQQQMMMVQVKQTGLVLALIWHRTMGQQQMMMPQGSEQHLLSGTISSSEDDSELVQPQTFKKTFSIFESDRGKVPHSIEHEISKFGAAPHPEVGAAASAAPEVSSIEKCNDERLKKIIMENLDNNPSTSKRAIQKAASEQIGGLFDVVCSTHDFSYLANTQLFCEAGNDDVTCFAFLHTLLQ
ncbi:hypothetical protein PFISCL1PPCAC_475 [Pristionchus fissidentatus]|uniref:Ground-like domain-containing protein n=1 Tax=Pristionchus fissidentatus TaxID=1538716 RepID=A0AAV5USG3_9BILA|nr:hypothetical protein PFISCL1PPCAC_475 [Pristionchus fissidentatus]